MHLIPANDFETVKAGYRDVTENTPHMRQYARWVYGKHPTDEGLMSLLGRGELYLWKEGDDVAGMIAIVMGQEQAYECIPWAETLANDQVATIHLLAVCPPYQGRGLGSRMLEEAAVLAAQKGREVLRLDVLASNLPAQRLYEKAGFSYRGKQDMYAENTGRTDFLFYEKTVGKERCNRDWKEQGPGSGKGPARTLR